MAPPRRDVLGETREFEMMRDALRRAVGPDARPRRWSWRSPSERRLVQTTLEPKTRTGPLMRCPMHGEVEVTEGAVECPMELLVMNDGVVGSHRCGERLSAW
jgi:hypothetical protein